MSNKLEKLQADRRKNDAKIAALKEKNAELTKQITELENLSIVGMVRSMGVTPEELAVLIQTGKTPVVQVPQEEVLQRDETH